MKQKKCSATFIQEVHQSPTVYTTPSAGDGLKPLDASPPILLTTLHNTVVWLVFEWRINFEIKIMGLKKKN